jgi:hypothetical protein
MLLSQELSQRNIVSRHTTGGAVEETADISLDQAAAAASVAVPEGETWLISDIAVCAPPTELALWRLQKSVDGGSNWSDLALGSIPGGNTKTVNFKTPIQVEGGDDVLLRSRVKTPGGAAQVTQTIGLASQP